MGQNVITQKLLKEYFHYNPDTGLFIRIKSYHKIHIGNIVGYKRKDGYIYINVISKQYLAHRLVWLYIYGYFPENSIDHINKNKSDNKIKNLREATHSCNMRNSKPHSDNTSGITGICLRNNKWVAQISHLNKPKYLGKFIDKNDAVKARWEGEKKYGYPNCQTTSSAYLYLKERNGL